jgi:hypothetical protein
MPISDGSRGAVPQPREALVRLLDGAQSLFREHLALARLELNEDLRGTGRHLLLGALGMPPLLAGYALVMVAVSLLLSRSLPDWLAFGVVALINLAAGGIVTAVFASRARAGRSGSALPH